MDCRDDCLDSDLCFCGHSVEHYDCVRTKRVGLYFDIALRERRINLKRKTNQSKYISELNVYVLQGAPEKRVRRDRGMFSLGQGADEKRNPLVTPPHAEVLHV